MPVIDEIAPIGTENPEQRGRGTYGNGGRSGVAPKQVAADACQYVYQNVLVSPVVVLYCEAQSQLGKHIDLYRAYKNVSYIPVEEYSSE